jgi:hypothetical protein
MKELRLFETSVNVYWATRCNILNDFNLHEKGCESLKYNSRFVTYIPICLKLVEVKNLEGKLQNPVLLIFCAKFKQKQRLLPPNSKYFLKLLSVCHKRKSFRVCHNDRKTTISFSWIDVCFSNDLGNSIYFVHNIYLLSM